MTATEENEAFVRLAEYFELIFPGRSPVAETHAGAILATLRCLDPEVVAEALGWERETDPHCEACDGTGAAWDETEVGSFDCGDCRPAFSPRRGET